MSPPRAQPKKPERPRKKVEPQVRARPSDLARHLSAVVKHLETPAMLEEAIGDVLVTMENCIDHNSPQMIDQALDAYCAAQEKAEKGDESNDTE